MTDGVIHSETVSAKDLLKKRQHFWVKNRLGKYNSNQGINGSLWLYGRADNLDILLCY